jgi:predicted MFS family arabinose efflux permease
MSATTSEGSASTDSRLTAREWLLLLVLAAVQFTHIVDFMIIMPLGPIFTAEMELTPAQFGLVVAAYTFSAGVAGLLAARFLDRFGRKAALLTLYGGFTVGTFLCAVAPNYVLLLAARTVAGAFGGTAASVVLAIVGDAFHDARRGMATGVVMSAFAVASIAGVPLGLYLADPDMLGWHGAFAALAGLSVLVLALAAAVLPPLRGHLGHPHAGLATTWEVLSEPNHLRAFGLTVTLVFSSFVIAPHLATYLVCNVGLSQPELKYMYLCGGLASLMTLTFFGRLADRLGKLRVFRVLAVVTLLPVVLSTNLPAGLPLAVVLVVTTLFMVTSSGRMVPAMALITACSPPRTRGSFLSLNAAVQHVSSGFAATLAGVLLTQPEGENGPLHGYPLVGLLACVAAAMSIFLAGRLRRAPAGDLAPDHAELTDIGPTANAVTPLAQPAADDLLPQ